MLYTREQAADYLQISIQTLDNYINEGEMDVYKFGRNVRISQEQIQNFLDQHIYSASQIGKLKDNSSIPVS